MKLIAKDQVRSVITRAVSNKTRVSTRGARLLGQFALRVHGLTGQWPSKSPAPSSRVSILRSSKRSFSTLYAAISTWRISGQSERAEGNTTAAIAVLERASLEPRWKTWFGESLGFLWIRMRSDLADAYLAAGRTADAEVVDRELRQLMAVADPHYPEKRQLEGRSRRP